MRIIKFRGKDATGQKGWVYGDLVHNMKVTATGLEPRVMVGGYEVDPETIGQFTSLYDKNKKEIYEGDIVKCDTFVYEVTCSKRFASFCLKRHQDMFLHYFGEAVEAEQVEVVGNIHDNPELLSRSKHA